MELPNLDCSRSVINLILFFEYFIWAPFCWSCESQWWRIVFYFHFGKFHGFWTQHLCSTAVLICGLVFHLESVFCLGSWCWRSTLWLSLSMNKIKLTPCHGNTVDFFWIIKTSSQAIRRTAKGQAEFLYSVQVLTYADLT